MCDALDVDLINTNLIMQASAGLGRMFFTGCTALWPYLLQNHEGVLEKFPNPSLFFNLIGTVCYGITAIFFLVIASEPDNPPSTALINFMYGLFGFWYSASFAGLGPLTQYVSMAPASVVRSLALFGGSAGTAGLLYNLIVPPIIASSNEGHAKCHRISCFKNIGILWLTTCIVGALVTILTIVGRIESGGSSEDVDEIEIHEEAISPMAKTEAESENCRSSSVRLSTTVRIKSQHLNRLISARVSLQQEPNKPNTAQGGDSGIETGRGEGPQQQEDEGGVVALSEKRRSVRRSVRQSIRMSVSRHMSSTPLAQAAVGSVDNPGKRVEEVDLQYSIDTHHSEGIEEDLVPRQVYLQGIGRTQSKALEGFTMGSYNVSKCLK